MLVALGAVQEMGHALTAFDVMACLHYPYLLLASMLVFIYLIPEKK